MIFLSDNPKPNPKPNLIIIWWWWFNINYFVCENFLHVIFNRILSIFNKSYKKICRKSYTSDFLIETRSLNRITVFFCSLSFTAVLWIPLPINDICVHVHIFLIRSINILAKNFLFIDWCWWSLVEQGEILQ